MISVGETRNSGSAIFPTVTQASPRVEGRGKPTADSERGASPMPWTRARPPGAMSVPPSAPFTIPVTVGMGVGASKFEASTVSPDCVSRKIDCPSAGTASVRVKGRMVSPICPMARRVQRRGQQRRLGDRSAVERLQAYSDRLARWFRDPMRRQPWCEARRRPARPRRRSFRWWIPAVAMGNRLGSRTLLSTTNRLSLNAPKAPPGRVGIGARNHPCVHRWHPTSLRFRPTSPATHSFPKEWRPEPSQPEPGCSRYPAWSARWPCGC